MYRLQMLVEADVEVSVEVGAAGQVSAARFLRVGTEFRPMAVAEAAQAEKRGKSVSIGTNVEITQIVNVQM
jgi:hypothetical protein